MKAGNVLIALWALTACSLGCDTIMGESSDDKAAQVDVAPATGAQAQLDETQRKLDETRKLLETTQQQAQEAQKNLEETKKQAQVAQAARDKAQWEKDVRELATDLERRIVYFRHHDTGLCFAYIWKETGEVVRPRYYENDGSYGTFRGGPALASVDCKAVETRLVNR